MSTKEETKRPLTSKERRQRELRRKRMKKKRQQRAMLLMLMAVIAIAAVAGIIYGIVRLIGGRTGGDMPITPKGDTATILLDAGHGGADLGLSNDLLEEKAVTLAIVEKVQIMLENYGYEVILIRSDDTRISKEERIQSALDSKADLLVSVHLNYADDDSVSGVETYYRKGSEESRYLAEQVQKEAVAESEAKDGGVKTGSFSILDEVDLPAVMIEAGYVSNAREAGSLSDDSYQNLIAKGIARGIILSVNEE
ncbi:MAG: N-acetylmuramoyl-L-alanine amidase [Lachnospiraceae bacterium]|jgi:N-acetylmuramoyl-L-alanine amidase|nr:N-acetylmuramoyl-L-alanine amidase [Lachnospiraceae bacterium]